MSNTCGIISYGYYVPRFRVRTRDIAKVWGENADSIEKGLGVKEKAVGAWDEDSATFAVEAARMALHCSGINPQDVEAVFVGSESKPYAVKPTASIVAEACSVTPCLTAADMEFACKAGTVAVQSCMGMAKSGMIKYGLAVGTDTAQARPADALEYTAGGAAAAFVIGCGGTDSSRSEQPRQLPIATIDETYSFTTDTPDFWRRQHAEFPSHAGRFSGEPAYFKHVSGAVKGILEKTGTKQSDYNYVVFHQPNGKFPTRVAKTLGFTEDKIRQGLVTPYIGNSYSASSLIGLASVLDVAKPGEKILVTSYGSGAGSDALALTVEKEIEQKGRRPTVKVLDYIAQNKAYIDYAGYIKHRRKIKSFE